VSGDAGESLHTCLPERRKNAASKRLARPVGPGTGVLDGHASGRDRIRTAVER
jgi:hypothetical protein